jgi:hypothetical protein
MRDKTLDNGASLNFRGLVRSERSLGVHFSDHWLWACKSCAFLGWSGPVTRPPRNVMDLCNQMSAYSIWIEYSLGTPNRACTIRTSIYFLCPFLPCILGVVKVKLDKV